jgi:hypothetical protein
VQLLLAHFVEGDIELAGGISCARAETQIPPGSAKPSSRAAMLTPSPKMSPFSTTMSPTLIPTRHSMRWETGTEAFRSAMPACTSVAQRTASTTLENSTSRPSPVVFTIRPRCSAILLSTRLVCCL